MLIEGGLAIGGEGCQEDRGKWHVDVVTGSEDRKRLQRKTLREACEAAGSIWQNWTVQAL